MTYYNKNICVHCSHIIYYILNKLCIFLHNNVYYLRLKHNLEFKMYIYNT